MTTFEEIIQKVSDNGGVATFRAQALREAQKAGRLTERINADIQRSLAGFGLATVPREPHLMPTSQWDLVRVYEVNSGVGRVIDAVLTLDHADAADEADALIASSVGGNANQVLQKIRDLLAGEA